MRLRIQSCSPLPDIKAWFVPDIHSAPASIYDLKEALCLCFGAFKTLKVGGKDLILQLDDFELLDDSPFSAVRDGDLICVKLSPFAQGGDVKMKVKQDETNITRQRKRKRSQSATFPIPGQSVRTPTVLPSLKQKVTESPEESDSESDTSSSSNSSSSSSSSSSPCPSWSSSTTSSSLPKPLIPQPTKTKQSIDTKQPTDNTTNPASRIIPLVPPGLGKNSTHSRNKRRRLKKSHEKEATSTILPVDTPGPPKGSSHTNKLPLGRRKPKPGSSGHPPDSHSLTSAKSRTSEVCNLTQRDREGPASDIVFALNDAFGTNPQEGDVSNLPNQVMMSSLRNKNKKKGFKQSMAGPLPQKIIFATNTTVPGSQQPASSSQDISIVNGEHSISSGTVQPCLIPPSEIQELGQLPSNMFVTSVDVESGMWNDYLPSLKKNGRKKKTLNGRDTANWDDSSQMEGITSEVRENGQFHNAGDGSLAFDTDAQVVTQAPSADIGLVPFDWDRAEKLWKECVVLEKPEQLGIGSLVGWKGLAMNPQTSSPEILLTVARVVSIYPGSSTFVMPSIVIRYLQRPGAGRAALAFGLRGGADGFNEDDEQVEDDEDEETFKWIELLEKQSRVIKLEF